MYAHRHAVALTDHGNMYGIKEFLDYCNSLNVKAKTKWEATLPTKQDEKGETVPDYDAASEKFVPFKPIVGCEAYCARRGRHSMTDEKAMSSEGREYLIDRSGWHLILLAKNKQGYHNLCRIISLGFMEDAYNYTPRIDKELLEEYQHYSSMYL